MSMSPVRGYVASFAVLPTDLWYTTVQAQHGSRLSDRRRGPAGPDLFPDGGYQCR